MDFGGERPLLKQALALEAGLGRRTPAARRSGPGLTKRSRTLGAPANVPSAITGPDGPDRVGANVPGCDPP